MVPHSLIPAGRHLTTLPNPLCCVSLDNRTALWLRTSCHHLLEFVCKKSCFQCQPEPPVNLLAGDADDLGSGDAMKVQLQHRSFRQPEGLSLAAPEGEVTQDTRATPRPATNPACDEACGKSFYRLSTTPKAWREAQEDCLAGDGRVAVVVNSVPPKLASRLAALGSPLWVGSRASDAVLMRPRPAITLSGVLPTRARRRHRGPCRVAVPGSGRPSTVGCRRRYHYLCEYLHRQDDRPSPPASILAGPTKPRSPCTAGWYPSGGSCYRTFSTWKTWAAAEETCVSHGGHLASVGSPSEHQALLSLSLGSEVTSPVWIGLRRAEGGADAFEWVDGTPFHPNLGWERSQPDHHLGREWCGAASLPGFALQDAVCLTVMPFVCEAAYGMSRNPLPPPPALPDQTCEGDPAWLRLGDHCYRLVGVEDQQPWGESNKRCLEEGAILASVHSLEENYWLQAKLLRLSVEAVWVGGRIRKEEYRWLDHTPFNFTNWAPGEPNNVHDQEDCLALYTRRQGYWNDQNCGFPAGRVCKRPLGSSQRPKLSIPAPTPAASSSHCPRGWTTAQGHRCYKYFAELRDFDGARAACRRETPDAELASVHTAEQQAYLTMLAGVEMTGAWLGMKRQQEHVLWVDQTPVTFTSWAAGEPSGTRATIKVEAGRRLRQVEECVELLTHSRAGMWNDVACSEKRAFLCQTPVEPAGLEYISPSPSTSPSPSSSPSPSWPSPSPSQSCPLPHSHYLRRGEHCYRHVLTPLPWQEAEDTCSREGAHLATALTKTQAAAVWVAVMEAELQEAWLGLRYEEEHEAFRWSSGWPLLHSHWSSDTSRESSGGCAALSASSGQWVVRPCLVTLPFICHLDATAATAEGTAVRTSSDSCPDKRWLDFGGPNCYLVVRDPKPWHDARYTCLLEGGDLTSIISGAEMTLLTMALHDVTQAVWIGLLREEHGQRWIDGLRLNFTNWNEGEPNGGAGLCTEVYSNTGRWNDVECSQVFPLTGSPG
ncbi:macrophage mannose receptor 1-like [Portunus trituberculatus]|uniref:macrophage mannose receptor 1-like n=1 Tax=Portunus trituberculatus TaxID=210409 RepID=UPI001E1D1B41|nr:macrophage mannose receptor 1-like [Portunus trituberculatus]